MNNKRFNKRFPVGIEPYSDYGQYKVCSVCGVEQEIRLANFPHYVDHKGIIRARARCRECSRIAAIKNAAKNREKRRIQAKEFYKNNPEYKKQWKEENRDFINQQERDRRVNDTYFRLRKNCSRMVSGMLRKSGSSKAGKSFLQYVEFTEEELKTHLEAQFDDNMNWENYGNYWSLDHIIPQSDTPYDTMEHPNFKISWALSNLRPYPMELNSRDGGTRVRHKKKM